MPGVTDLTPRQRLVRGLPVKPEEGSNHAPRGSQLTRVEITEQIVESMRARDIGFD